MLIFLVASLEALAYLSAVPVCAAFCLTVGDGLRLGVGVGAFERRFASRRARRRSRPLPAGVKLRPAPGVRLAVKALAQLRGAGIRLTGRLGLGDAAATALACGALEALGAALAARVGRVEIDVRPAFDAREAEVALQGMIRVRAGHIIAAAARGGMDEIHRRLAQWKDIPSKT